MPLLGGRAFQNGRTLAKAGAPGALAAIIFRRPYTLTLRSSSLLADRAFQNGRTLAKAGAPGALLAILQRGGDAAAGPDVAAAVCGAVKRLAVTDEICVEFADACGVDTCLQARASWACRQAACGVQGACLQAVGMQLSGTQCICSRHF